MSDTVFLEKAADFRGEKESGVRPLRRDHRIEAGPLRLAIRIEAGGFVKHVHCEGARFHVLWWDSTGRHCGVKNCVVNAPLESDE